MNRALECLQSSITKKEGIVVKVAVSIVLMDMIKIQILSENNCLDEKDNIIIYFTGLVKLFCTN